MSKLQFLGQYNNLKCSLTKLTRSLLQRVSSKACPKPSKILTRHFISSSSEEQKLSTKTECVLTTGHMPGESDVPDAEPKSKIKGVNASDEMPDFQELKAKVDRAAVDSTPTGEITEEHDQGEPDRLSNDPSLQTDPNLALIGGKTVTKHLPTNTPDPVKVEYQFQLTRECTLVLRKGDITQWFINGKTDAIVNAANKRMLGGSGVDGAIHGAAGPGLLRACKAVKEVSPGVRCPTGEARLTRGFNLPAAYVIHTVGPIYQSPKESAGPLASAYASSVKLAEEHNIEYIAFPAISCGIYGYPLAESAAVAMDSLRQNVKSLKEVQFLLFGEDAWNAWTKEALSCFNEVSLDHKVQGE